MSIRQRTPALTAFAVAVVLFVTVGGIASLAYVAVYGDGHEYSTPAGPPLGLAVCPSAQAVKMVDHLKRLREGAADYVAETDCTPGPIVASDCIGPPEAGWTQVRVWGDFVEGWRPEGGDCPEEGHQDCAKVERGRGVVYVRPTADPHHVVGHGSLQLSHTTAATSWMHGCDHCALDPEDPERWAPGPQPTWIRCTP